MILGKKDNKTEITKAAENSTTEAPNNNKQAAQKNNLTMPEQIDCSQQENFFEVILNIGDPESANAILTYHIKAKNKEEAIEAITIRQGWPANGGVELVHPEMASFQTRQLMDRPNTYHYASERLLFAPEIFLGLLEDALRLAKSPIKRLSHEKDGSPFLTDYFDTNRFVYGALLFKISPTAPATPPVVSVDVIISEKETVNVFNGMSWVEEGPWIAATNHALRVVEKAAAETRRAEAEHNKTMLTSKKYDRSEKLNLAKEVLSKDAKSE